MFDFYSAWNYLNSHSIFKNHFQECLTIDVVKVNPTSNEIDNDNSLNTKVEIWLECGPYLRDCVTHDIELDCGGNTFEEAIVNLAILVNENYTNDDNIAKKRIQQLYF